MGKIKILQWGTLFLAWTLAAAWSLSGQEAVTPSTPTEHKIPDPALSVPPRNRCSSPSHRFWDKTNTTLFLGVGAARSLDYASTRHFRAQGRDEALLTNGIVDNKPLFAAIQTAGALASIGVSYWLHRTGHHKLERWVSVIHLGIGTFGAVRNYALDPVISAHFPARQINYVGR